MTTKPTTSKKKTVNIHQRMNAARADCNQVLEKTEMAHARFTSVTHDQITAAVRDPLLKHGVSFWNHDIKTNIDGNTTFVAGSTTFCSIDNPDDKFTTDWIGSGTSNTGHGIGIAMSYGMKYLFSKLLLIMSGTTDEADMYVTEQVRAEPRAQAEEPRTEAQRNQLRKLFIQAEEAKAGVTGSILNHFGAETVVELNKTQAQQCIQHITKNINENKEG